jgi:hypothetical protein
MIRVFPGIVFTCSENKKIQPFLRTELIMGLYNSFKDETLGFDVYYGGVLQPMTYVHYDDVITKYGGVGWGGGIALGAIYKITDSIGIVAEINGIYETYGFTKGRESAYDGSGIGNGQNFIYEDNYDSNSVNNISKPIAEPKQYYPFNSVGIKFGVQFSF